MAGGQRRAGRQHGADPVGGQLQRPFVGSEAQDLHLCRAGPLADDGGQGHAQRRVQGRQIATRPQDQPPHGQGKADPRDRALRKGGGRE